jgi:hypothetical protein
MTMPFAGRDLSLLRTCTTMRLLIDTALPACKGAMLRGCFSLRFPVCGLSAALLGATPIVVWPARSVLIAGSSRPPTHAMFTKD